MVKTDKDFYDRKIVYLDYFESGEKVKNGGFVKWEARGETSRIQIHIRGLYPTDTLRGEIQLISRQMVHTADNIKIDYGSGEYVAAWKNKDLAGTAVSYEECDGVQVKLSESRLLVGQWREREALEESKVTETSVEAEKETTEQESKSAPQIHAMAEGEEAEVSAKAERKAAEQESAMEVSAGAEKEPAERKSVLEASAGAEREAVERKSVSETSARAEKETTERKSATEMPAGRNRGEAGGGKETKTTEKKAGQNPQCRDLLSGDKWEQLNKQYPHIHPFGDAREYLSITPRDFVILSRKYQELVQNSFLLHGYYNYGHVILTRIKEKNGERFYLGVPGVYYTREKQAALMFGFEGFEAGTEQAVDGGFGYYMKQVDI
ncbi:MAG: hypothetical protein K2G16_07235 [Lachnospiraceae bacterium]|nr:hypothetical protein [Lachnospiraceae bacterium]